MGDDKDSLYAYAIKRKKKSYHCHQGNDGRTTKFKGGTEDIKNDAFILGKKMGNICLKSKRVFIGYIGKKHGAWSKLTTITCKGGVDHHRCKVSKVDHDQG